ncbi:MAG: hypothetical protein OXK74_17350, partial [Gemmatimonadota bacterium]|nr:hypothetical protein [Gemmatimonadota bacterium]
MLLGDPGAGKTTAFEDEAEQLGDEARLVSARDFLGLDDPGAASTEGTLFIDGLDEVRAGQRDARSPLDRIRRRLRKLGQPRFRLSCREADWLGENDRKHLAQVSPNGEVTILRLDPLTDQEIEAVLGGHAAIENPSQFLWTARERGLDVLLTNPLTLRLLIRVVAGGDEWPGSRVDAFEKACLVIVREYNAEHVAAAYRKPSHPPEKLLEVAGHLCAVQLLTGASGFS